MKASITSHNKDKIPYESAIEYLFNLQKFGIKFGLSKTENILKAFGNPHLGQNYIHIAGTNGKRLGGRLYGVNPAGGRVSGRHVRLTPPGPIYGTFQNQR